MRDTKDIAGRWARATTWHGIADIYNSTTKGQRLLWLFLVTICTGLASWQIYVTVVQYLSGNGYTTNVYFMRSGSIQIPPITVCNINRAKKTVRDKLNMTDSQIEAFYSAILGTYLFSDLGVQSGWASLLASNPYAKDLRGLMSNLAHTCTDMIMYYKESFGFSIPGSQICTNESIVTTVLTLFGQCYSLKNGNLQQIIAGKNDTCGS